MGRAIQLIARQSFFPPQLPPLGAAEQVRDDLRTRARSVFKAVYASS
jgi:hypothetical protein